MWKVQILLKGKSSIKTVLDGAQKNREFIFAYFCFKQEREKGFNFLTAKKWEKLNFFQFQPKNDFAIVFIPNHPPTYPPPPSAPLPDFST